jgi:hypothetical protein
LNRGSERGVIGDIGFDIEEVIRQLKEGVFSVSVSNLIVLHQAVGVGVNMILLAKSTI